jgi:hypothetical protein
MVLDRRQFLAGGALTVAALAAADRADAAGSADVLGGVVEGTPSPTTLAVYIPDLGTSRTVTLAAGAVALHGRAGVVTSLDVFQAGERVVFMPESSGADGERIGVSELASLMQSEVIDVTSDGPTVTADQGRFQKAANFATAVPLGRVRATFWVDPASGERYLCVARRA